MARNINRRSRQIRDKQEKRATAITRKMFNLGGSPYNVATRPSILGGSTYRSGDLLSIPTRLPSVRRKRLDRKGVRRDRQHLVLSLVMSLLSACRPSLDPRLPILVSQSLVVLLLHPQAAVGGVGEIANDIATQSHEAPNINGKTLLRSTSPARDMIFRSLHRTSFGAGKGRYRAETPTPR